MSWKLYLFDPVDEDHDIIVARTLAEAKALLRRNGMPEFIHFDYWRDNGMGPLTGPSGLDLATWIAVQGFILPEGFGVFSADPIACLQIQTILGIQPTKVAA